MGELSFEGSFPSLEFIGSDAFRDLRGVAVSFSLPLGAPALQCLGQFAFAQTQWQTQLVIQGEFPCLRAVDPNKGLDKDGEWVGTPNAGDDIFKEVPGQLSTDRVKLNVKNCKPGATGWCSETLAGCNSVNGFAESDWCEANNQYVCCLLARTHARTRARALAAPLARALSLGLLLRISLLSVLF